MPRYVVQAGDTLGHIAQQHGITLSALLQANPEITNPNLIRPGQTINIPEAQVETPASVGTSTGSQDPTDGVCVDQLCHIVPGLQHDKSATLVGPINQAMQEASINTPARQAAFLAQIAHETGGFKWFRELGNDAYFERYEGRTDLGNTQPGDGPRYRGRGFIQITGRANYTKAGQALGLDLVNHPQLAETPEVGARIAAWFWQSHGLNALADQADDAAFQTITRRINGGLNGLDDRRAYYARARSVLEVDGG
jgi:predicted chitinase